MHYFMDQGITAPLGASILQKCQNIIFWKLVWAGFHPILHCRPDKTSFQVDIDIYEELLGQSGYMFLSSHITNEYIIYLNSNRD